MLAYCGAENVSLVTLTMLNKPEVAADKREAVVIKKYANRRLYNTETSTYVTLEDLATMVRNDKDFVVFDAKTGDDLTHSVLTQIIVEQESREGGQTLLPVPFLRQLIRFYDDQIGRMVPSYLQFSIEALAKEQEKFRSQFTQAFSNPAAAFDLYQEQTRKNMAMFEQALKMWNPFGVGMPAMPVPAMKDAKRPEQSAQGPQLVPNSANQAGDELNELKAQLAAMQQKLEKISQTRG